MKGAAATVSGQALWRVGPQRPAARQGASRSIDDAEAGQLDAVPNDAQGPSSRSPDGRRASRWWGAVLPLVLLAGLEAAVRTGLVASHLLPPPSEIARTVVELAGNGLGVHVLASTARVLAGFALGATLAGAVGSAVGLSPRCRAIVDPTFQALRAIPSLAWVPLLLLWLGIDEAPKIALIAIGAFFPVYMGVASGFRDVDRKLIEVAELSGLSPTAMVRRVLLPAAMPSVLTGLRNGLSLAWMFMVAAELIAATRGLGYLLTDGRETGRADIVFAAILLLAVLGKTTDSAMARFETHRLAWRDTLDTRG